MAVGTDRRLERLSSQLRIEHNCRSSKHRRATATLDSDQTRSDRCSRRRFHSWGGSGQEWDSTSHHGVCLPWPMAHGWPDQRSDLLRSGRRYSGMYAVNSSSAWKDFIPSDRQHHLWEVWDDWSVHADTPALRHYRSAAPAIWPR